MQGRTCKSKTFVIIIYDESYVIISRMQLFDITGERANLDTKFSLTQIKPFSAAGSKRLGPVF